MNDRLDPHFYLPRFKKLLAALRRVPYEVLGNIAKLSYQKWDTEEHQETTFRYIEINSVSRETEEVSFSVISTKNAPSRAQMIVQKDDIIISLTRPHHGSIAQINESLDGCIASTGFAILREIKDPTLNRTYLYSVLRSQLCLQQMLQRSSGGNYPAITADQLMRILIPIPQPNIQNHIASFMRSAYSQKKQKEREAEALLDSIDNYVLKELGIEIPHEKENNIENRVFTATLSEVSGRRFDPEMYYQIYSLHTKSYPMEKFQNCVLINPTTSFSGYEPDTSTTFVPMEKVSAEYGEADLSLRKTVAEAKGYTRFRDNDLIWAKITPCMENGKSAVVDNLKEGIGCGSTEFHVFRALEGINIHYIHALLRLKSLRKHAVLHFTGSAGQQRVSGEFFKELIIPKPPIENQTEIADYITNTRNRAKQLQQEANVIVEEAKERVERILLAEV
jgi:type I restriction enzyme S subunit